MQAFPLRDRRGNATVNRLKKPVGLGNRRAFLRVQSSGQRFKGRLMIVQAAPAEAPGPARVGFTVSRKVGNAVVRNRVRRRLKEIVRLRQATMAAAHDVVIIAFPGAAQASFETLEQEVSCLLARARAWALQRSSSLA